MLQYKLETDFQNDFVFYPSLNFIQKSSIEANFNSPEDEQIINEFLNFFEQFNQFRFIDKQFTDIFCNIIVQMHNNHIEIPKKIIFCSSFPFSLVQTIKQLLIQYIRGDRFLSSYIWVLSYIIGFDNSYFDDDLILMLIEIISKHTNFTTTFLHSIACLNCILQNEKYDNIFLTQIDQILNIASKLNNSQSIVQFSQLLVTISQKKIDLKYLKCITKILIHFATEPISGNDMNGVLCTIDNFISISDEYLNLMVDSGLIQNLPHILNIISKFQSNQIIIDIIDKLTTSQFFTVFIFNKDIAVNSLDLFCVKICGNESELQIKCIDIINRLVFKSSSNLKDNLFLPLLKNTVIIDKLCEKMTNVSFNVKYSISQLFLNLIHTRYLDIINKILNEETIEFLIESEQLSGLSESDKLKYSLYVCLELSKDELLKEYIAEKLKEIELESE